MEIFRVRTWIMWITWCKTVRQLQKTPYYRPFSGLWAKKRQVEKGKKNPQDILHQNVNNLVDNVDKLTGKKVFSNIYNVSGAHSYQQIILFTIFQNKFFNL